MVCILSTQSRKVRHKHPRRFLALPLRAHHLFLPTTQVMDRVFILLKQIPTDSLHITSFIYHLQRFGPRLRTQAVVRCSCPLDAAVTLLLSPLCGAVWPTDSTSRTADVYAGGPFPLRHTFQHLYELHYLTESLQY